MSVTVKDTFFRSTHPFRYSVPLNSPWDGTEIFIKKNRLENSLYQGGIDDYKFRVIGSDLYVELPKKNDLETLCLLVGKPVRKEVYEFDDDYDVRKIKRVCTRLQKCIDGTELYGAVRVELDRRNKRINVAALDDYLCDKFFALMSDESVVQVQEKHKGAPEIQLAL